jgi:hypothetical protein
MTKKITPEKQEELDRLKGRVLITLDFIASREEFPNIADFKAVTEAAYSRGDVRGLRLIARDIDKSTVGLSAHDRDGLEAILQQKLGVDKDAERLALKRDVARILERGSVASEKERRRLEDYAEMLVAMRGDAAEIDAVRRLLDR